MALRYWEGFPEPREPEAHVRLKVLHHTGKLSHLTLILNPGNEFFFLLQVQVSHIYTASLRKPKFHFSKRF